MVDVRATEAERFYEDDEDPEEVFAAFDAGPKGRTTSPSGPITTHGLDRLRHEIAVALRRIANAVESPHARALSTRAPVPQRV
jgi:hypothetical protein